MGEQLGIGNNPSLFEKNIFSSRIPLASSLYIRMMHPKTAIQPNPVTIKKVLDAGWCGQLKIHGHRAQIHIPADPDQEIIAYTRHARRHKVELPPSMVKELRRLFQPKRGWNVIDAEWLKPEEKLFVFDFLKKEDELLNRLNYLQRWQMLPREYLSPHLSTLPLFRTLEKCLTELKRKDEHIEGLVFKSLTTPGFEDTSIIRCRKQL